MIETDSLGNPIEERPDTILVWTQHFSEDAVIKEEQAKKADMLITCYPNHIENQSWLEKHIFPNHDDVVLLNYLDDGLVKVFPDKKTDS